MCTDCIGSYNGLHRASLFPPPFLVIGDLGCSIGLSFPRQALPTLFIYGKWGKLRYQGVWASDLPTRVITPLVKERKVDEKNFFIKKPARGLGCA
jgi:hypothetical protein